MLKSTMMNSLSYSSSILLPLLTCCTGVLFISTGAVLTNGTFEKPTLATSPQSTVKEVGTDVDFNCTVNGHMPLSAALRWYRDSEPLPESNTKILDDGTVQLILSKVRFAHHGFYTCCLVLQNGRCSGNEAHVHLKVGYLPDPVENLTCFSHDPFNGFCTWNNAQRQSMLETTHVLQRKLHNSNRMIWTTVSCRDVTLDTTADKMCAIRGEKTYRYRTISENALGETITYLISPKATFNVFFDAIPLPPVSIVLRARSSHSLNVDWEPPLEFKFLSYMLSYKIRHNSNFHSNWTEIEQITDLVTTSMVITDLDPPYANVCVQVAVRYENNKKVWGKWSESICSRLLEERPSEKPENLKANVSMDEETNQKNVLLSWDQVRKEKQNGKILGYNISLTGHLHGVTKFSRIYSVPEYETWSQIKGLNRTYNVTIHVVAYNKQGTSPPATVIILANPKAAKVTTVKDLHEALVVSFALTLILFVACLIFYCTWRKHSKRKFEVQIPEIATQNNKYSKALATSFCSQEAEHFDELRTSNDEPYVNMHGADDNAYKNDVIHMYQNFVGNKTFPADFVPLLQVPGSEEAGVEMDTLPSAVTHLLSGVNDRAEQYSPRSVGSGGSYWSGREDGDVVYKIMTPQGLSPIDKCTPGNQWEENTEQAKDNVAEYVKDNSFYDESSTAELYVKQSVLLGTPGTDTRGRSSSQYLSGNHLIAIPNFSRIDANSRASSQELLETEIDSYVQQGQVALLQNSCEGAVKKHVACFDQEKHDRSSEEGTMHDNGNDHCDTQVPTYVQSGIALNEFHRESPISSSQHGNIVQGMGNRESESSSASSSITFEDTGHACLSDETAYTPNNLDLYVFEKFHDIPKTKDIASEFDHSCSLSEALELYGGNVGTVSDINIPRLLVNEGNDTTHKNTDINFSQTNSKMSVVELRYGSLKQNSSIDDCYKTDPENTVITVGTPPDSSDDDENVLDNVFNTRSEDIDPVLSPVVKDLLEDSISSEYVPHATMMRKSGTPVAHQAICKLDKNNCNSSSYLMHSNDSHSLAVQPQHLLNTTSSRQGSDDGYSSSNGNNSSPVTPNLLKNTDLPQNRSLQDNIYKTDHDIPAQSKDATVDM